MINFIDGKLKEILENKIVVETGGVGYDIFFPSSNFKNLPAIEESIKVYTYMHVKEDEMSLYGFLTREDKEMYLKLLTVNGVGPKGALNIISTLGFSTLVKAISSEDSKLIASVQGIGSKTASKICIELGDKVRKMNFEGKIDIIKANNEANEKISAIKDEVTEALVKLGYKESKARELLSSIEVNGDESASDILKLALKQKP
ncbi:MAG: Holliday junction branch migration protein RuvA [Lachnospiraceae bacterium]|nr:Holliday junction branch migration protein RuvA [Lachnospiraceae bacterium]MBR1844630.1 Holliday junction branch migration protein RuvA [Lachnospiraceae bacterium]